MMISPANLVVLIAALFIVFLTIALLFVLHKLSKIEKSLSLEEKFDKRKSRTLSKKIDEQVSQKIDELVKGANERLLKEIDRQIEKMALDAAKAAREMGNFVKDQQGSIVKESQLMVANVVLKAQKEAEIYRQNQIERLEGQINSIVASAAREVLGRMISIREHEDLVKQALERAKRDRFFAV